MVVAADARGLPASLRQIRDWVQLGLLDRPMKTGLGRGLGTRATFPEGQLQLFVRLLEARANGVAISALARYPVWIWLRWGDAYVPLPQVRRVLRTWARAVMDPSLAAAKAGARKAGASVAAPGTKPGVVRRFERTLVDQQWPGGFERAGLFEVARETIGNSVQRGPKGAQLNAEIYLDQVEARQIAISRLEQTTDAEFELARDRYRIEARNYRNNQPALARDPELGRIFEVRTDSEEMNAACIDLVTILGFEWLSKNSAKRRPPTVR